MSTKRRAATRRAKMSADSWRVTAENGFLIWPEPHPPLTPRDVPSAGEAICAIEAAAQAVPRWIASGRLRSEIAQLPRISLGELDTLEERVLERLHQLYGLLASAYVHSPPHGETLLPAVLAIPLTDLSRHLERPPIFSYVGMVLANWRRRTDGPLSLETVDVPYTLSGLEDERWFFKVHIAIEARAGGILAAIADAIAGASNGDDNAVMASLRDMRRGLADLVRIFNHMPDACDPDIYYQQVRPYLFGFAGVRYEGVDDQPQTWRGGSGAQSAIVPAVLAALGVQHRQSELTVHLQTMRDYMPKAHRRYLDALTHSPIRAYATRTLLLRDAYNHVLRALMTFRRAHLYYAKTYIFEKSTNPTGTGGTPFMDFLQQLIAETDAQLL